MKRFFKFLFIKLPLALILLSVLIVLALKWVPVWVTPIMVSRSIEFRSDPDFHTVKEWCPLEDISPELMKAVITSEDNLFCEHDG
ncbi:MAG: transglycosylase domain-containing protein, partial [Bacteroidales bacterium]|nr:transglycosylase domain-containing protein [Bacteroidales bacterium]